MVKKNIDQNNDNNQEQQLQAELDEARIYEVSFILDYKLDAEKILTKLQVTKDLISSLGGDLISEEQPYRRLLAYQMVRVQNNVNVRFNEGYFGWLKFSLQANHIKTLEKKLKLDEEVIRFLVLRSEIGNDVFTKDQSVFQSTGKILETETKNKINIPDDINIDTTTENISDVKEGGPELMANNIQSAV